MTTHVCGNREQRTARLILALISDDDDNYQQVIREVGDCVMCWKALCDWLVGLLASDRTLKAGGPEQAADYLLTELARLLQ